MSDLTAVSPLGHGWRVLDASPDPQENEKEKPMNAFRPNGAHLTRAIFASTSVALLALGASAQGYGTHIGKGCNRAPIIDQVGAARAAGRLELSVTSQLPKPPTILALGVQLLPVPLVLQGCNVYLNPIALVGVSKDGKGKGKLTLSIPGSLKGDFRIYVQALEDDRAASRLNLSDALCVLIHGTPPVISGMSTSSAVAGQRFTITGSFPGKFQDMCVGMPGGGLGIIEGGTSTSLTVRAEAFKGAVSGPIQLLAGRRARIDKSKFPKIPGLPAPVDVSAFTGTPIATNMTASRQKVSVKATSGHTPFTVSAAATNKTVTMDFGSGCVKDDCLRIFMRIYENGKCHDVYFLEDGKWAGKTVKIPANMSGNVCALWFCTLLQVSLQDRIPGFQCSVVGTQVQITVTTGTGITGAEGGVWISKSGC